MPRSTEGRQGGKEDGAEEEPQRSPKRSLQRCNDPQSHGLSMQKADAKDIGKDGLMWRKIEIKQFMKKADAEK